MKFAFIRIRLSVGLCTFLSMLNVNEQVFFYQIIKFTKFMSFDEFVTLDEEHGATTVTMDLNRRANIDGYTLSTDLYATAKRYSVNTVKLSDLGINILLINFAKYYARSQYHLFVYQFEELTEIENFEKKLLACSQSFIKLPKNLAVHARYGLKACSEKFKNVGSMSVLYFDQMIAYMSSKHITPEQFVKNVSCYHVSIIETLYAFASFTRQNRIILDCRDLHTNKLVYTFEKIRKSTVYTGIYWFVVPRNVVWFAYSNGSMKKTNYITRDDEERLHRALKNIAHIVVGFMLNGVVFPVKIDNFAYTGKWDQTIEYFRANNLNVIFQHGYPTFKNAYFVNDKQSSIYQFV